MKILHVLYQSLPQISGSSIRSRDIMMSQKEIGLEVLSITAPFQSYFKKKAIFFGTNYIFSNVNENSKNSISDRKKNILIRINRLFFILRFYTEIKKIVKKENPTIIHAHAMFFCGIPSLIISKRFNIPFVYEIRSLWVLKKENTKKTYLEEIIEFFLMKIEIFVAKKSDKTIVISENLKSFFIEKGVEALKIEVIPNAVNTSYIQNNIIKNPNNNNNNNNFGYIGTLTSYEGLEDLIVVFNQFAKESKRLNLIIYGTGIEEEKLNRLVKADNIKFKGQVDADKIHLAFAEIDFIVNPRIKNKITDTVTPLKPLEAMAYKKIFIGSNVGGIKELVIHNENGLLFEAGDVNQLRKTIEEASLMSKSEKSRIINNAFEYVQHQKSWLNNAEKYKIIYKDLKK